jgi:hypothetical protein
MDVNQSTSVTPLTNLIQAPSATHFAGSKQQKKNDNNPHSTYIRPIEGAGDQTAMYTLKADVDTHGQFRYLLAAVTAKLLD